MTDTKKSAAMGQGTVWSGGDVAGRNNFGRGRGARRGVMLPGRGGRGRMVFPRGSPRVPFSRTGRCATGGGDAYGGSFYGDGPGVEGPRGQVGVRGGVNRGARAVPPGLSRFGRGSGPVERGRGGNLISPPSKFDKINRYIGHKIFSCLTREEQEILGQAYPKYRPRPLNQQQQFMLAKKKALEAQKKEWLRVKKETEEDEERKEKDDEGLETDKAEVEIDDTAGTGSKLKNKCADEIKKTSEEDKIEIDSICHSNSTTNASDKEDHESIASVDNNNLEDPDELCLFETDGDGTIPPPDPNCDCEVCVSALKDPATKVNYDKTDRIKALQQSDCARCRALRQGFTRAFGLNGNDCDCRKCRENAPKKAEMMKEREEAIKLNLTDCHTLLARLNTKRLYKRVKYLKRRNKNYNFDKAYPYHQTTDEIADTEWEELLEDYKKRRTDLFPDYKREKRVKSEETDDDCNDNDKHDYDYEYARDMPSKYDILMFTPCPRAVAVLASYPRSGNSLMRNLYEKITLRVTGSDMMGGLQKHDLVGEMATGTTNVQFVKTHYPERMGAPAFAVARAVLLVRNPYDAMDSYFNLMTTNTHTTSLTEEDRKKHSDLFAQMAKKEVLVWRDFHEFWLKQKIPLLVVRYEDLTRWTAKVIGKVIKFVLEVNSMTFFEDRIARALGEEQIEKLGPYKARSGGIGRSLTKGHYSPKLLNQINYGIIGTMEKFGYKEMLIPKPDEWKLEPLDRLGVYIPGSVEKIVINDKGLVRGPRRQTNWMQVKQKIQERVKSEDVEDQKVSLF